MLRVEEISAHGAGHEQWKKQGQQPGQPPQGHDQDDNERQMQQQGKQAIKMFPRRTNKGKNDHPQKKYKEISKQNRQRVAHE